MKPLRIILVVIAALMLGALAAPSLVSVATAEPCTEHCEPSPDPTVEPSADPSPEPCTEHCEPTVDPSPDPSPEPTPEPKPKPERHGIVKLVAHCAPSGRDPRFEFVSMRNHGGFVRAAAHGETVSFGGASYDLSTEDGARAMCAALEAMRSQMVKSYHPTADGGGTDTAKHKGKAKTKKHKKAHH